MELCRIIQNLIIPKMVYIEYLYSLYTKKKTDKTNKNNGFQKSELVIDSYMFIKLIKLVTTNQAHNGNYSLGKDQTNNQNLKMPKRTLCAKFIVLRTHTQFFFQT